MTSITSAARYRATSSFWGIDRCRYWTGEAPSVAAARHSYIVNMLSALAIGILLGLSGLALLHYYTHRPERLAENMTPRDAGDKLARHRRRNGIAVVVGVRADGLGQPLAGELLLGVDQDHAIHGRVDQGLQPHPRHHHPPLHYLRSKQIHLNRHRQLPSIR